jgi:Coenzyme PQQ synthesis protein D (PqqD)
MDQSRRPIRSASVKWRVLDEEGVLVDLDSSTYFTLNSVGLFIWDRCSGEFYPDEIVDGIAEEFEVEVDTARQDLESFLGSLAERGLIDYVEEPEVASLGG